MARKWYVIKGFNGLLNLLVMLTQFSMQYDVYYNSNSVRPTKITPAYENELKPTRFRCSCPKFPGNDNSFSSQPLTLSYHPPRPLEPSIHRESSWNFSLSLLLITKWVAVRARTRTRRPAG
jgi:hypothetical protein